MRVRRLEIERFRGIRSLDWRFIGDTAGLLGPGDAGKTTILDALERVLSPRWNFTFDDSDFYGLDASLPIRIRATLTDMPPSFVKESKFGLYMHAYDVASGTALAPTGGEQETFALIIELEVDDGLEPQWNVVDASGERHPIHARDREALGMLRVGGNVDHHFRWSRGSVLSRVTEPGDEVAAVIADATRRARAGLAVGGLERLQGAATKVEELGKGMGASVPRPLVPHLDLGSIQLSSGALSLHAGEVPLRRTGLGTRRLITVAMQHHVAGSGGVTLVDEFEHGLEPHRIRQLLRRLQGTAPGNSTMKSGQLVLTTHAPVVLSELEPEELAVVRRDAGGATRVVPVSKALAKIVLRTPTALLARRVIVAEGATETGLLRSAEQAWSSSGPNFAYLGTAVADGGGQEGPRIAGALVDLGYTVALFVDQDAAKPKLSLAKTAKIIGWPKGLATENVLAKDLSDNGFAALVELAHRSPKVRSPAQRSMRDAFAAAVGKKAAEIGDDLAAWIVSISDFRTVFGNVAKKNDWFKTYELGRAVGDIIVADWAHLEGRALRTVLEALREFAERG